MEGILGHPELSGCPISCSLNLVVKNDVEQGTGDLQSDFKTSGVVNQTQLSQSVHEEADTRTSCPNHLGQGFLADFGNHGFGDPFLTKMSQPQKHASQAFLTGVEQLIDQILS